MARYLGKDELALYTLIFNRFVSSQMNPAVYDRTTVDIETGEAVFRATGQVVKFDGFMRVYTEGQDELSDDDEAATLPVMNEGETLKLLGFEPEQHFTQPPPRFSQATLIKELEEKGIGRPSTYAAIMTSILNREYVEEDPGKRLRPTSLGRVVAELLMKAFPDILEVSFTAQLEEELDEVENGKENWVKTLRRFYGPFKKSLGEAKKKMPTVKRKGLPTGLKCDLDDGEMVIKWGRNGEFLACTGYPECKNTKEFQRRPDGTVEIVLPKVTTDEKCETCGAPMLVKRGRFGEFLACSGYPECKTTKPVTLGIACLEAGCGGQLVERRSKRGKTFYACNKYPDCKFVAWARPIALPCPKCGAAFLTERIAKGGRRTRACIRGECGYKVEVAPSAA